MMKYFLVSALVFLFTGYSAGITVSQTTNPYKVSSRHPELVSGSLDSASPYLQEIADQARNDGFAERRNVRSAPTQSSPINSRLWTNELRNDELLNRYQINIQVKGNHISGICMLKKSEEGWRGTVINEFGVKAFDFVITPKKCELLHTISFLNKWYIRRTIAGDLHFLFEIDNPAVAFQKKTVRYEQDGMLEIHYKKSKSITRASNNVLILNNLKRNIVYFLNTISE